jgi:hypothetical protein
MAFSAAHPEVSISHDRGTGQWEAACPEGRDGTREIRSAELKNLLDALEEHYGGERR